MTGNEPGVRVTYQVVGLWLLWMTAAGVQTWATIMDYDCAGRWAIMLTGASASWTAIYGVKRVMCRIAGRVLEQLRVMMEEQAEGRCAEVADLVVRRLELRDLEQQVAHLLPRQPSGS